MLWAVTTTSQPHVDPPGQPAAGDSATLQGAGRGETPGAAPLRRSGDAAHAEPRRSSWAPGRVNLIGDHTDYNEGTALPMAVDLGVLMHLYPDPETSILSITSDAQSAPAEIDLTALDIGENLSRVTPFWARYIAAVCTVMGGVRSGGTLEITSTLPAGAGLSSSAALEVATALAFGYEGDPMTLALLTQRAEHVATGVPCGIMDQLTVAAATPGNGLLIDFHTMSLAHVPIPTSVDVVVIHSGERRSLAAGHYAERRAECEAAAVSIGPLGLASRLDLPALADPVLRRRARHVITECERVRDYARALSSGDLIGAGQLMFESHRSLAEDFEVSTPALDAMVEVLRDTPGVRGARLTGAGFGGCAVALADHGARIGEAAERYRQIYTPSTRSAAWSASLAGRYWIVEPSAGAQLIS